MQDPSLLTTLVTIRSVHSEVYDILLTAFSNIYKNNPGKKFVYAEAGFQKGGEFNPHKTHQNGLSVDLMVPVLDVNSKKPIKLPTNLFNKWGTISI